MIYENVERIREARGITKTFLAKKIGISLQGYMHIATGHVRLDVERLKTLAMILNVEPAIFFDSKLTEFVIREIEKIS
ncbi:helix-turn-helix transcriptional regulator [Neobacillus sp. PS3-40]|uniref:helix-turn-helix domain-containing protein n=1 Tax=Neobacillus sp. PS3-40 TaxID=3070679 RepID=UPI0027E082C9|nr:helix-turn-helix transcriptional regulator [Neobacillus sp. PS3-40]WML43112.1 helix-turn-helix transcriptional regulator [Neobacillus sp. PS3-40]